MPLSVKKSPLSMRHILPSSWRRVLHCVASHGLLHAPTTGDPCPAAGASLLAEVAPHGTRMVAARHGIHSQGQFFLPRKRGEE
jgi:hypothetical protein